MNTLNALAGWSLCLTVLGMTAPASTSGEQTPIYRDAKASLETRVEDLFGRLTPEEKLNLLGGTGFTTHAIARLGVPAMAMADAGQGVRGGSRTTEGPATAFPSGVAMAATWDVDLLRRIGQAIGEEARNKGTGIQVELGPAVNIHRTPLGGRNGEYFSEDPYLAARLAVSYIQGMQSSGVAACVKHFACNNQEWDRTSINAIVDERTLREIYLPAFEAAVKEGKVWSVMSSYNLVNGAHSSANSFLLTGVLKKDWGFDGLVMSDWGGVHETTVVQAGNDLEMPNNQFMTVAKLKAALADGSVTQAAVDDSVHRILRTIFRTGLMDGSMKPDATKVNSTDHAKLAFEAATKGIVLLKNDGNILPLDALGIKSIAVIGEAAHKLQVGALGSPYVHPLKTEEILDAIRAQAGNNVTVRYAAGCQQKPLPASVITAPAGGGQHGFRAEYFANRNLQGSPVLVRQEDEIDISQAGSPGPGVPDSKYSVRWTGKLTAPKTGTFTFAFTVDDGFRLFLDGKLLMGQWTDGAERTLMASTVLQEGQSYDLKVEYFQNEGDAAAHLKWQIPGDMAFADAVEAAKGADVAVVCVSTAGTEGEGSDRSGFELPQDQAEMIRAVAAVNKKTIVVLNNGTPVSMKGWQAQVPALLEAWFPGQEGGAAVAAVLFGQVNPSGKLPDTFAASRGDYPDLPNYPGVNQQEKYSESIYVGYRHFDKTGIDPIFPFGYGLSYTTFDYKNLKVSSDKLQPDGKITVTVEVTNTGKREGEEVVQLYTHDPAPKTDKTIRELKGFRKIALTAGETKTVEFALAPRDFAWFDVGGHQWKADAGQYEIQVGASSRDLRCKSLVQLDEDFTEKVREN